MQASTQIDAIARLEMFEESIIVVCACSAILSAHNGVTVADCEGPTSTDIGVQKEGNEPTLVSSATRRCASLSLLSPA